MLVKRRKFLQAALEAGAALAVPSTRAQQIRETWIKTWHLALETLAGNVRRVPHFDQPVLCGGSVYQGTWLECGPHESLSYARLSEFVNPAPDTPAPIEVAKNTHRAFFTLQREDGQLPANVKLYAAAGL
jgi:hypothetical protein